MILQGTTECIGFGYPKPAEPSKTITCFFCDVLTDMPTGTITKEYKVTNMLVTQTTDLTFSPVYYGLCDDTGIPKLYTDTASSNSG